MSALSLQRVAPLDAFYEWLLSDAPAARGERSRRRTHNTAQAEHERAQVTAWCQRTLDNDAADPHLRGLAEAMQRLVSRGAARELAEADVPDDAWVRRERRQHEASRRVAGDHDYRYPARYVGSDAADQPVPDERVPVHAFQQGDRVRLGPNEAPAAVAAVQARGDRILVFTADGQRRRYPATAWQFRVHDERYRPDAVRDVANAEPAQLRHHRSGTGRER